MDIKEEEEIKKEFQLERVILFTDAVFAIILTIMVLDIKLPEGIRSFEANAIHHAFKELIPKFLAYFLTFALVSRFWMIHLKLFRYLKDYDAKLLVLNLFFLFSVTLFPFAVSLISGRVDPQSAEFSLVWTIYVSVFYAAVFLQSLISHHLIKNRDKLCINTSLLEDNLKWRTIRINLYLVPVLIVVIFGFNYFNLPYYYPVYTVAAYGVIMARVDKSYYPEASKGPLIIQLFRYVKPNASKTRAVAKKKKN